MENKSSFKNLTGKSTANRPLGRPGHRFEDSFRIIRCHCE